MPRRALRLSRGVFDFTHLIEMYERIEVGEIDAGKRPANGETVAFEAHGCRGDLFDRTLELPRTRGRYLRQGQYVINGHSRHRSQLQTQ